MRNNENDLPFLLVLTASFIQAQDKVALNRLDSTILAHVIGPTQQQARQNGQEVNWEHALDKEPSNEIYKAT